MEVVASVSKILHKAQRVSLEVYPDIAEGGVFQYYGISVKEMKCGGQIYFHTVAGVFFRAYREGHVSCGDEGRALHLTLENPGVKGLEL